MNDETERLWETFVRDAEPTVSSGGIGASRTMINVTANAETLDVADRICIEAANAIFYGFHRLIRQDSGIRNVCPVSPKSNELEQPIDQPARHASRRCLVVDHTSPPG